MSTNHEPTKDQLKDWLIGMGLFQQENDPEDRFHWVFELQKEGLKFWAAQPLGIPEIRIETNATMQEESIHSVESRGRLTMLDEFHQLLRDLTLQEPTCSTNCAMDGHQLPADRFVFAQTIPLASLTKGSFYRALTALERCIQLVFNWENRQAALAGA